MISNKVVFRLFERVNFRTKSRTEWALSAQFVGGDRWVITSWGRKPTDKTIANAKDIIMRSFEVYHRHLRVPEFGLTEVK